MSDAYPPAPPSYAAVAPASERWNVLSIVGFVLVFFVSLGAVICGHIALSQIKRTGEKGHGLALAAVILGYVGIAVGIIIVIAYATIFAAAIATSGTSN